MRSAPIDGSDVHRWRTRASPFVVGIKRRVHRVQRNACGFEPVRDFANVLLAVGVVEMLARGKNLDRLGSRFHQLIEQAGMQPFLHIDVG